MGEMRKILFRGKRTNNGEWVYGSFIPDLLEVYHNGSDKWLGDWGFIKPFGKTKEDRLMVEVERETVGQYTGIMDKNGKKIFEGDIIDTPKYGVDNGKGQNYSGKDKFVVGFADGTYYLENHLRRFSLRPDIGAEVVGNIYDNPELLEK